MLRTTSFKSEDLSLIIVSSEYQLLHDSLRHVSVYSSANSKERFDETQHFLFSSASMDLPVDQQV